MMNFSLSTGNSVFPKTLTLTLALLFALVLDAAAQTVRGVVKDAAGTSLPGVTVLRNGDVKNGVITDLDGNYSIQANSADYLTFSYVGMKTQRVRVGNRRTINVTLADESSTLNDVVVVGYGTAKKQSLTGAVTALKGDELLKAPSTNVANMLGGRMAGLTSVQTSGEPGNDFAALRIRGSQYGALYIVDGVARSMNDIDPNDIESISVLKDGAAAAVYGLNAAGGVVIITTKKGRQGKTRVSYDGQYGISVNANFPTFMNGPEYADYYNMADLMDKLTGTTLKSRDQYTPVFTSQHIKAMLNDDPTDGWDNVDYIGKVFGTGHNQKHNVTLEGGSDDIHYFLSGGFMSQQGNIANFNYRRYNVRANIDTKVGRDWKLTFGAVGTVGRRQTPGYASGGADDGSQSDEEEVGWLSIGHQAIMMHPFLPEKHKGLYTGTLPNNAGVSYSPLAAIYESGYGRTHSFELNSNFSLRYDARWLRGLSFAFTGAYDYLSSQSKNLATPYKTYTMSMASDNFGTFILNDDPRNSAETLNHVSDGQYTTQKLTGQFRLEYARQFGRHNVDAMGLLEINDYKSSNFAGYVDHVPFPQIADLSYGQAITSSSPVSGVNNHTRTAGYVFRLKYDYANRYLAEFSGRYDGSYHFSGSGKRWGFFPSFSAAWRVSGEDFMEGARGWLDDLKVRGSLGLLGNDNVAAYSYLSTYAFATQRVFDGTAYSSMYTSGIANPALTWAKTRTTNIGLNATLWHGLLGLEFDWFYNLNYDLLASNSGGKAPSMGGYYPTYVNNNRYSNYGIDWTVSHRNRFTLGGKPFDYNASVNMTYAKSKWLRYQDDPNAQEWRKVVGTSVDAYSAWVAEGLYRSEEEITKSAWYGSRPNLGDIKFKDLNGDGVISEQDKARIGRSNRPQIMMGLSLGAQWNGFDFNALFTAGLKFDVSLLGTYYNGYDDNTVWSQTFKEGANSPLWLVQNSYSLDNPDGKYPRLTLGNVSHGGANGLASTFWMKKGDYLRFKDFQIGYTLPATWLNAAGIQKVRFFVEGSNLFTIDNLPTGVDPESPRVNNGYYPQQRTFLGGVNITF